MVKNNAVLMFLVGGALGFISGSLVMRGMRFARFNGASLAPSSPVELAPGSIKRLARIRR